MNELFRTLVTAILAGAAGGLLTLAVIERPEAQEAQPASSDHAALMSIDGRLAEVEERIAEFETAPGPEILREESQEVPGIGPHVTVDSAADEQSSSPGDQFFEIMRRRTDKTNSKLREFGWTEIDIAALERLRIQARLQAEERAFHQTRAMLDQNPGLLRGSSALRDGLSEERYEEYLRATGNERLAAPVRHILEGSAGDVAGLRSGDLIRRYGSERVYNDQDLTIAMIQGEYGEPVTVEVERDDTIFYLTVPRGPLGSTSVGSMMIW
jgi:hypothetical protein